MSIATRVHVDGGDIRFERVQDCTAIAEHAQALHKEGLHGTSEMRHAASFPMVLVEKYLNDKNISFQEFMSEEVHVKAMLVDPALSAFRVWGGRV
ncbi:hypothetical protein [Undibacterium sp. TS12]|uniref:hypothetical protein n=1 Tax=Undibacterium sp. TS12 TaxID=2908202 RepID=UPI001F4C8741|nr:hypothetical protein [Undibacterium sp. TS12]MCH8622643.1 hypothetical protein [Undibacterium sp. TS12]